MTNEYILVEKSEGVAILTMNRPDKLNAMNRQLTDELQEAVKHINADDEIGCIVITGAGKRAFSAGGDIHEQREDDRKYTQEELDARTAIRSRGSYEITLDTAFRRVVVSDLSAPCRDVPAALEPRFTLPSDRDSRVRLRHWSLPFTSALSERTNSSGK